MMHRGRTPARRASLTRRFLRDERGANGVEFALLFVPFISLLLFVCQIGIYFSAKMALDTGVLKQAESLQAAFGTSSTPVLPSAGTFRSNVVSSAGGLIDSSTKLKLEIQPLVNLSVTALPITDGLTNYGVARTALAIRASFTSPSFVPGMSNSFVVYSSALVRRHDK